MCNSKSITFNKVRQLVSTVRLSIMVCNQDADVVYCALVARF